MLDWAKDNECDLIISSSNSVNPQPTNASNPNEYSITAIGNTVGARNRLKDSKIALLNNGDDRRNSGSIIKSESQCWVLM